jgi:superkiller protein 3
MDIAVPAAPPTAAPGAASEPFLRAARHEPQVSSGTRMRLRFASWLRISDTIMSRAVSAYDTLFSLDPHDEAEIYMDIGADLGSSGKPEEALASLKRAVALRPQDPQAWLQLGIVQLRMNASPLALDAFEKAKALGATGYELHFRMAEALGDLNKSEEAVCHLQQAAADNPHSAEAFYRLGVELDRLKRFEEAVQAFRRAMELAPREASYYQSLGFTLDTLGKRDEAVECFKRAVELQRRMDQLGVR